MLGMSVHSAYTIPGAQSCQVVRRPLPCPASRLPGLRSLSMFCTNRQRGARFSSRLLHGPPFSTGSQRGYGACGPLIAFTFVSHFTAHSDLIFASDRPRRHNNLLLQNRSPCVLYSATYDARRATLFHSQEPCTTSSVTNLETSEFATFQSNSFPSPAA